MGELVSISTEYISKSALRHVKGTFCYSNRTAAERDTNMVADNITQVMEEQQMTTQKTYKVDQITPVILR